jgi:3-oxoacyl-[acyl-carrier protein] reductase
MIPNRFNNRRAVITGGASGIGKGVAERLTAEGADVIIWDIQSGGRKIDITDADAVQAAMAVDRPDLLVCSAGITGPNKTTWDYDPADWREVFDLNVNALFYCNRAAAPIMMERGYGRIVNIASIAGKEGNPNAPAYSSSKAAVIGLTKSLGKELATSGVTCNAIAPAAIATPIFDQMTDEHIAYMKSKIPMGRFGKIEEMASLICWILSEESAFCTGTVFDNSGGRATY